MHTLRFLTVLMVAALLNGCAESDPDLSLAFEDDIRASRVALPDELGSANLYTPAPANATGRGVIVIHEWWGLNDYARDRARQLAEQGHAAIAVDMYGHGDVAEHPDDAQAFMEAALQEPEIMTARIEAARQILAGHERVEPDRIYAVGYCFGGAVALEQARRGAELAGVASFHGSLGTGQPADAGDIQARVLVATGGADPMVPADQVADFVEEMSRAGAELQLLSFPGVKHSFTNPAATELGEQFDLPLAWDEHADRTSWQALLRFLEE